MSLLTSNQARAVTVLLALQAVGYYAVALRAERTPEIAPLSTFPRVSGGWVTRQESQLEPAVQEVLRADDTLTREYANASGDVSTLLIAFFKTQREGQAPHSPKNCLPGSGWEPEEDTKISVAVPGRTDPIQINRYVVSHGMEKSVTLYWYQSHDRVIASEYLAKFWLVADAIRYHRSDTALVRVIAPVRDGNVEQAASTGVDFIRAIFPDVVKQLPR
jgi:EpsI family protein